MPSLTTLIINFYGMRLRVRGTYVPADPSVGLGSNFEIYDVCAKLGTSLFLYYDEYAELAEDSLDMPVYDYLREAATRQCEEALDEAAIARHTS